MRRRGPLALLLLLALCAAPLLTRRAPPRQGPAPAPVAPLSLAPAAPAPAAPADVECQTAEPIDPSSPVYVDELDPDTFEPLGALTASVFEDYLRFTPQRGDGVGWVRAAGYLPRAIGWADGACIGLVELVRRPSRAVSGVVDGPVEVGAVAVHGACEGEERGGFSGSIGAERTFTVRVPAEVPCAVYVTRVFGRGTLSSESVPLPGTSGDVDGLVLQSPVQPGLGVSFYPSDGGLRVYGVEAGSPAERAGLRMYDLVVAADGEPAEGLEPEALEEADEVRVEVLRDGGRLSLELTSSR